MEDIIQQLTTDFTAKILKMINTDGALCNIDKLCSSLKPLCNSYAVSIVKEHIRQLNSDIRADSAGRKEKGLAIKELERPRAILTSLGTIEYKRDYYHDNVNNCYVYPVDEAIGVERRARVTDTVNAGLVQAATVMPYSKSSEYVTDRKVSRQHIHNAVKKVNIPDNFEELQEKKRVSELHVFADEDHAHLQRGTRKKRNVKMIPLVVVTEGEEIETKSGKRTITVNPMRFTDKDFNTEQLWKTVSGYILATYDMTVLKAIYVHCDGGKWIKNGLKEFAQTVHVMDGYHLCKELMKVSNMFPGLELKKVLDKALQDNDPELAATGLNVAATSCETEKEKESLRRFRVYLTGFWNECVLRKQGTLPGSGTEGYVSHDLSDRFSRDPISWSEECLGRLASARIMTLNGYRIEADHMKDPDKPLSTYREYLDKIIEGIAKDVKDWSIFEKEEPLMDTAAPIMKCLHSIGTASGILS